MKISALASLYWSASVDNLRQLDSMFGEALEKAIIISKETLNKTVDSLDNSFVTIEKCKVKRIYSTLSGNIVTVDDMTSLEIKEAVKCGACIELIVPAESAETVEVTLHYGQGIIDIIGKAAVNLNDVVENYGSLVNSIAGKEVGNLASYIDNEADEDELESILSIIRTYAIKNKKLDLLKSDSMSKAANKLVSEMLANFVYTMQK